MLVAPAFQRLRQKDGSKFEDSGGYLMRTCVTKKKKLLKIYDSQNENSDNIKMSLKLSVLKQEHFPCP